MNWKHSFFVSLLGCFAIPFLVIPFPGVTTFAHAQVTPEAFLGMIPAVPQNLCSATKEEKATYLAQVEEFNKKIDAEIKRRTQEATSRAKESQGKTKPRVEAQPGDIQKMGSLVQEQMQLIQRLNEGKEKLRKRLDELEHDPKAKSILEGEIRPLESRWSHLVGVYTKSGAAEMDQIAFKLRDLTSRYCEDCSPKYRSILSDYLSFVKSSFSDYNRLDQIQREFAKVIVTGAEKKMAEPGLGGIRAVGDYARLLRGVFKYDVRPHFIQGN
jgi:hypothetical protein